MGGGRDFLGRRIYRKSGGKYIRVTPTKSELLNAVRNAENEEQLAKALNDVGFEGKTDFLKNDNFDFATKKNFSVGLSKMAVEYGTDVFKELRPVQMSVFVLGQAHIDDFDSELGTIDMNAKVYEAGQDRKWAYRDGGRLGYDSPKNIDDEMVVEHEYAHLLQKKLGEHSDYVKEQIARRDKWEKDFNEINEYTGGMAKKYIDIYEKWDFTKATKVKTRQKLQNQMYEIMQEVIKKQGLDAIPMLNKLPKLASDNPIVHMIDYREGGEQKIRELFKSVGASSPVDVAEKLTGNREAYASKNWEESHAECVSDYMHNGRNASPISIAYVREMNKLIKK